MRIVAVSIVGVLFGVVLGAVGLVAVVILAEDRARDQAGEHYLNDIGVYR
jgi:hypothetical protein